MAQEQHIMGDGVSHTGCSSRWWGLGLASLLGGSLLVGGCSNPAARETTAQPETAEAPVVVDLAVAQPAAAQTARTYTGTTAPVRQVSLRSQAEGQLLRLSVDVGDPVQTGQALAEVDNVLLQTALGQASAELAARQFEVSQAEAELADAQTLVEQARAELQQAQSDNDRIQALVAKGAISEQEAEQTQTALKTAQQRLNSAQQQVRTRQQAIATAGQRASAQGALVSQGQKRLSYAVLASPLNGIVLEKLAEPGELVQVGQPVLTLGDFQEAQVKIDIIDSDRTDFSVGQTVQVQLDAFPGETIQGRVTRIAPAADPASRLIPVEITLPNPDRKISSGLLARVTVSDAASSAVRIPESALTVSDSPDTVFIIRESGPDQIAEPRSVQVGARTQGQVEILSGLAPGESFVVRSSQPLQPGQVVTKSLLSDP